MRTDTVRAKVSHETKKGAELVLNRLGLTMSEAINLMLIQVKLQKALPFDITLSKRPNATTLAAMNEAENHPERLTKTTLEQLEKDWNDVRA